MNTLKLFFVIVIAAAFAISCSQTSSTPDANTNAIHSHVETNMAPANTNISAGAANGVKPGGSLDAKRPAAALRAIGMEEALETPLADLYNENCMVCHKNTGKGGKITIEGKTINPIDLTSAKIKARSDDKLLAEIKEGVPDEGMPGFSGKLTDEEIKSIVQYIKTLK